ncbi:receptor-like protein kinase FERONIA [Lotus japonicus]|uniref:receptor-like protein kinase FERONIA n=1 Tax=Lotus japonicus TaxID=34305 RepID=UPI002585D84D|nr:receptor-like protein kinase FERONIA [Lotus japonicus]
MENFRKNRVPIETTLSMTLLLLLFLLFSLEVNSYEYDPVDNLAINCGFSGSITFFERNWVGDIDTKFIEPQTEQPSVTSSASSTPSSVDQVPFATVRHSQSKFTYSFPVSNGPKFLRLHFYPTTYANFEPNNALFSVTVGNLTLLKHFNASLWVNRDDDNYLTVTKEYIINVETGERLNVTFTPTTTTSYAFINGIEVVSMPPYLYYTDPNDSDPSDDLKLLGRGTQSGIDTHKALETIYRVNVGENQISPHDDTGMFRYWENDSPRYLEHEYPGSYQSGFNVQLNYKHNSVPNYTAPENVYKTARSYGKYADAAANYNVTWNFEVDSEFTYMVRLHFCEFEYWLIKNVGDRVFQIFIGDTLAEHNADVIVWSASSNLVPVHRDYALPLYSQGGSSSQSKKINLSIKLRRLPKSMITRYHDVILNGIEIFKISDDADNNLAGPNPQPQPVLSPPQQVLLPSKNSNNTIVIIVVVVVAVSFLILAFAMGVLVFLRRRRRSRDTEDTKKEGSTSLPSHLCRYFTIAEIRAATNNFDEVFIIGVGGFGNVYKGYIDGGFTPVAIKRLKSGSQQGVNEFLNEIEMLSQLRHVHLVSLIGYCNDGVEMILVYDFMQHGTLRECLYHSDSIQPLTWKQRLEILLGAARGLHYLHAGAKHNIIHRDVKSTNILLDEKWVAKVSDFGLSKVGPTGTSMTHVSTVVKGSFGYLDPEYYKRQRLTLKSDVYSFGVVLLEVLSARPPLVRNLEKNKVSLVDWFRRCYEQGGIYEIEEIVDPYLKDSISDDCLRCYCQMALSCLHDDGNQRPAMSDVVGVLEFALQLVVVSEEDRRRRFGGTQEEGIESEQRLSRFIGDGDHESGGVLFTSSDDFGSGTSKVTTVSASTEEENPLVSATVFSEIGNPSAR